MTITSSVAASGLPTRTWTRAYQYATPSAWLATSPEGRQTRTTLDDTERVTKLEVLGADPATLASVQYHYDTSGRVDQVTNGTRVLGTTYNAAVWVSGTMAPRASTRASRAATPTAARSRSFSRAAYRWHDLRPRG